MILNASLHQYHLPLFGVGSLELGSDMRSIFARPITSAGESAASSTAETGMVHKPDAVAKELSQWEARLNSYRKAAQEAKAANESTAPTAGNDQATTQPPAPAEPAEGPQAPEAPAAQAPDAAVPPADAPETGTLPPAAPDAPAAPAPGVPAEPPVVEAAPEPAPPPAANQPAPPASTPGTGGSGGGLGGILGKILGF